MSDRKIRWIVQEKLRGGSGEIALIQHVSHRRIEQIWQTYKRTGIPPTLKKPGRPKKAATTIREATLVLKTYDILKVNGRPQIWEITFVCVRDDPLCQA